MNKLLLISTRRLPIPLLNDWLRHFCLLVVLFSVTVCNVIYAQQSNTSELKVVYKGVVIDDQDLPLAGVNVSLKDVKNVGVTTDTEGRFQIRLSPGRHILVFTYIGMKTKYVRRKDVP